MVVSAQVKLVGVRIFVGTATLQDVRVMVLREDIEEPLRRKVNYHSNSKPEVHNVLPFPRCAAAGRGISYSGKEGSESIMFRKGGTRMTARFLASDSDSDILEGLILI